MTQRIVDTSATEPGIVDISPTLPGVDPAVVAAALGAEPAGVTRERGGSPLSLFLLRAELIKRLQPSGSRSSPNTQPVADEDPQGVKVSISEQEWRELEALAASLAKEGFTFSAKQVAGALLRLSLRSLTERGPQAVKEQLREHVLTEMEVVR